MSMTNTDSVQHVGIYMDPLKWGTDTYYYWPKSPEGIFLQLAYFEKKAIKACLLNLETGATQELVLGVDYDVTDPSLAGDKYLYPLVSLADKYGSYSVYDDMCIWRESDFIQQEDFAEGARINPLSIKNEFSRLYSEMQELRDSVNRTIHIGKADPSLPDSTLEDETARWQVPAKGERANKFPSFDSNGDLELVEAADNKAVVERFASDEQRLKALEDAMLSVDVGVDANSENLVFGQGM